MNKSVKQITKGNYEGSYVFGEDEMTKQVEMIPPGIYKIQDIGNMFSGIKLMYIPVVTKEKYINIKGGTVGSVLKRTDIFFKEEIKQRYTDIGVAHKTGILLYGPPGTGKTVTSHIIMSRLAEKYNAICIVIGKNEPEIWKACLEEILPMGRPIIFFSDECEWTLRRYENEWLTFLDGHESITNFIFIGCTNYVNQISARMKRPSRIEHLIEVSSIEEEVAKQYVEEKVQKLSSDIRAAMVHYAMENKTTIDVFKNAVKEFYVYNEKGTANEFETILKSYIREEEE